MISIDEARSIIQQTVPEASVRAMPLKKAGMLALAADIIAPYNIPGFRQSSVDGYAFIHSDCKEQLRLVGEVQAGSIEPLTTHPLTATRIFTGGPVPEGADTVVMQEKVSVEDGQLSISDENIKQGENVRAIGSEICAGETAMRRGTLLTPAAQGFLSGIGISDVKVYAAPRITIVLTGNEIRQPGTVLAFGEVYDASSIMLEALCRQMGINTVSLLWAADTAAETESALRSALEQSDIVLATGGVSVGDFDFVANAAKACNIQQQFHRIRQKPGKPLLYGTQENKIFFGLPGNPSSVLTCFYEYVMPAIEQYMHKQPTLKVSSAIAKAAYRKPVGLTHFIKAFYEENTVTPLHAQESYRLHSFAQANCLMVLPEESTGCVSGDTVTIHILPF